MDARRRAVLRSAVGAVGALALPGCSTGDDDALVRVLNDTDATVTVTTEIRDLAAGEQVLAETFDLPPAPDGGDPDEGSRVFDEAVEPDGRYEVTVSVDGGPSGTDEYDAGFGRLWAVLKPVSVDFQNVD